MSIRVVFGAMGLEFACTGGREVGQRGRRQRKWQCRNCSRKEGEQADKLQAKEGVGPR